MIQILWIRPYYTATHFNKQIEGYSYEFIDFTDSHPRRLVRMTEA